MFRGLFIFQNQNDSVGKLNKPKVLNSERFLLADNWDSARVHQFNVKSGRSLYRQRGKPERVMAEIRRTLLEKISARLEKERKETELGGRTSLRLGNGHENDQSKDF
jgi:hypothetical protein